MSRNVFKPRGKVRKYEAGAGVATIKNVPIIATVMDNIDPTNSGKLFVFPSESFDKASQDRDTWIPVRRLHTFFGSVRPTASPTEETDDNGNVTSSEYGQYITNPSSYGQWNAPPDIGTKVICIFVNGDLNYGFYIGAVPDPDELQMIPAIGSSDNIIANEGEAQSYGGATTLPVTNINTNNKDIADSPDYLTAAKPIHSYAASIMQQQGILRDRIRGPIGSSASREATSRVGWGVSTPGRPIYEGGFTDGGANSLASKINKKESGDTEDDFNTSMRVVARRGGHSLVMDDGDIIGRDQLIRLRTALGHQILMSDDGQVLMLLHSNGQSYIELGKEGTVDVFSTNSINLRTQGDLNLHADNMVNIHAGKDVNINAQENMIFNSVKKFKQSVGDVYELHGLQNLLFKSDQNIAMEAAGKWSGKASGEAYINGSKVHLNDGEAGVTPVAVEPIAIIKHPDTLFDSTVGWAGAPGKLDSITSRAPAHYPWLMAGQGVDVNVDPSADAQLPAAAPSNVSDLIDDAAANASVPGLSTATVSSVPEVGAVSKAVDKGATTSLLGGMATLAAAGPGAAATVATNLAGATQYVDNVTGVRTAAIGSFAQTPTQLSAGGILKPGADIMVNTLIKAGKAKDPYTGAFTDAAVRTVMPNNIFTGKGGVNSYDNLISSTTAQSKSIVTNLQKAQTGLTKNRTITGNEGYGALTGIVSAAASSPDLNAGINNVKRVANGYAPAGNNSTNNLNAIKKAVSQGTASAIKAQFTGPSGGVAASLASITDSVLSTATGSANFSNSLDTKLGPVASAFKTITKTFVPMTANVPQNLSALAGNLRSATSGGSVSALARNSVVMVDAANQVQRGLAPGLAAAAASGISNLPGGSAIAGMTVDSSDILRSVNKNPLVPGMAGSSGLISQVSSKLATKAFSGVDVGNSSNAVTGLLSGVGNVDGLADNFIQSRVTALGTGAAGLGDVAVGVVSALKSLTGSSGDNAKTPTIGINTFNRSKLTTLINNTIGPTQVPRPNLLGQIARADVNKAMGLSIFNDILLSKRKEIIALDETLATAQSAYSVALASYPEGDARIATAKAAYDSAVTALQTAVTAYDTATGTIPSVPNAGAATTDTAAAIAKIATVLNTLQNTAKNDANQTYGSSETTAADAAAVQNAILNATGVYAEGTSPGEGWTNEWFNAPGYNAYNPETFNFSGYANSTVGSGSETQNIVTPNDFSQKGVVINLNQETGYLGGGNWSWNYTGGVGNAATPGSSLSDETGWNYGDGLGDNPYTNADNATAPGYWVYNGTQFVWVVGPVSDRNPYEPKTYENVQEGGADVEENTVENITGPSDDNTNPSPGGAGCVVLESYIPAVESTVINSRLIEQAWQLRTDHNISLGKGDASLETYMGKVVFNYIELQPCVRLLTKSGVSLVCSTTAPIFTKDLEFVDAPNLIRKEVACMKNDETFWDEIVSIEDVGEKFVAVINAGDTAFWAGETNEAYMLHHNVINDDLGSGYKKK